MLSFQGSLAQLASKAARLAAASRQRSEALAANFVAPLKEATRYLKSVQSTMADRSAALATLQRAKGDLESAKVTEMSSFPPIPTVLVTPQHAG